MTHARAARPLLWLLVPPYRLGLALREFQLRAGLKPIRRLSWPVVSIGNLSTGGSGKTPLTIALAKALTARGLHVDVLSRGYGRISHLPALVDPHGTVADVGDEPLLIARETGVPVYVAAERYQAGLLAEAERQGTNHPSGQTSPTGGPDREQATPPGKHRPPGAPAGNKGTRPRESDGARERMGVHLLDDGFQHRQLARDVDILLLNRRDLTDALLPAGNLREALHAAERAHIIALPADEPEVERELSSRGWQGLTWRIRRYMEIPAIDSPVAAFCGIARPAQFFEGLESAGLRLAARIAFPDHHSYTMRDLDRVATAARDAGATEFVTTEKDRVRLGKLAASFSASFPLRTIGLRIEIEDEDAAIDWLFTHFAVRQANQT